MAHDIWQSDAGDRSPGHRQPAPEVGDKLGKDMGSEPPRPCKQTTAGTVLYTKRGTTRSRGMNPIPLSYWPRGGHRRWEKDTGSGIPQVKDAGQRRVYA